MANNIRNSSFHAEDDLISSFCSDDLNINSRPFVLQRKRTLWQRVSVEPVMFLYMFAFMMTTVIEDSFFLDKACRVNLGFPANICDHINLKNNTVYKKQVQIVVSNFRQYEGIALHAVPMVLALLLGSWSDKHGRKFPMLLGLSGALFYALMIIVNTLQDWPLEVVLFTATFPSAMTGSSLAIFLAAFTYISDITKPNNRTSRVTLLEVSYLITMPTGLAAGSYVFTHLVNRSYTLMFCIHAVLLTIAIIYATLTMETYSNRSAETGRSSYVKSKSEGTNVVTNDERPSRCCLLDIWDWNIIVDTFKTVFKKRTENRRMYLLLIILAMGFYTFQRDEKHMVYLYTQLKFHWPVDEYSKFRTFQSAFFLLGLLVGVPMVRAFSLPDTIVIMFGCISHSIARVIFATAIHPSVFYIGAAVAAFGPVVAPVLRSMTSKLVPASERGKVFSMLTVADTSLPVISSAIYTQVYNATIDTLPSAFFWVTVTTQILVFIIALVIHCLLRGKLIEQAEDDKHLQDQLVSDNSVQNIENT